MFWWHIVQVNTRAVDRSQSGGTGPSAYGTGPTVINNLGPVPKYCFMKNLEDLTLKIGYKSKYYHIMA